VPGLDHAIGEVPGGCAEHAACQHCQHDHCVLPPV
jgi:hypothetical protein